MRLVKQTILYFKEGNSDKVYEIDLCNVGENKYVVNFRYGRRGATLKEGSKTAVPVALADAEKIYNAVEDEKLTKGYTTSPDAVSSKPLPPTFTPDIQVTVNTDWMSVLPAGRDRAILERLHHAAAGTKPPAKTEWKLSRVIWKAGQFKIAAATPYIIQLYTKGDLLHQYVCTWALVRCGTEPATNFLQTIYREHSSALIKKIAGAGLLVALKDQQAVHYLNALPEPFKQAIEANQVAGLDALLQERIAQEQQQYNWIESLYLLSVVKRWLRPSVKQLLQQVALKPGYFKHIRSIFKLAELLDDFEIEGLLTIRFEREKEFFDYRIEADGEAYVDAIDEYAVPSKELLKKNSRLAYSQKTRWYLHRRIRRQLQRLGDANHTDYVKLATGILIAYNRKLDFAEAFSERSYAWNGRQYVTTEIRFPQNARSVLLHQLLSGNHPQLRLLKGQIWRLKTDAEMGATARKPSANTAKKEGGFLQKLAGLFGKKKQAPAPAREAVPEPVAPTANDNGTPYLHLWNQRPEAYVQLLMAAQLEEIHEFAREALISHPAYYDIKQKLDKEACKQLLLSPFANPAEFGYTIATEKYPQPDADLVIAMLNSINGNARNKGKELTEANKDAYLQNSEFVKDLLFAIHPEIISWSRDILRTASLAADLKNVVVGKSIAWLMGITTMNEENEKVIKNASDSLFAFFAPEVQAVPIAVIADLLQHQAPVVLLVGLRILRSQKDIIQPAWLSSSLLVGLLQHSYAPVREEGLAFLNEVSDDVLLGYQNELIASLSSTHQNVRRGLAPIIARLASSNKQFGDKAAEALMPFLWRKETSEGMHDDISRLLCNELSHHLQNVDKETALKLLYGNYAAAQNVGVIILEKYTDPSQLTLPQVIALGNHENLNVRSWSWKFYNEQAARVKYEKEAAVKLLESKWEDTRAFAKQFFRDHFTEADWTPEALIILADSVKPDIEAFGRELITRFFNSAQGVDYLIKLSQHPSEKMQLFATNYLERFAAGDLLRIQSLEYYFRSVLTRVNKSRIAKNRIYEFLLVEGRKSEEAAKTIGAILSDVSAIAAIRDKAKCIEVLLQLKSLYAVETPLQVREIETR